MSEQQSQKNKIIISTSNLNPNNNKFLTNQQQIINVHIDRTSFRSLSKNKPTNKFFYFMNYMIIFTLLINVVILQHIDLNDIEDDIYQTGNSLRTNNMNMNMMDVNFEQKQEKEKEKIQQQKQKMDIKLLEFKQYEIIEKELLAKSKQQQEELIRDKQYRDSFLNDKDLELMIPDNDNGTVKNNNDSYIFSISINSIVKRVENNRFKLGSQKALISRKQYLRSIVRTQLIHNVNLKGEIKPQLTQFDRSLEAKRRAIKKIMDDQQRYYESVYRISKYMQNPKRFCLIVPSYMNVKSRLYLRNLDSIFMQDYTNYHVVYIDDASSDNTGQFVKKYIKDRGIPQDKIRVIINSINMGGLRNTYNVIHQYCKDGEIVGVIDGDDSFNGRKVFQLYNAIYKSKQVAFVYSNFLRIRYNYSPSVGFGSSLSQEDFQAGKLRKKAFLLATHFLTYYADVFKKIKKQDLTYQNGTFINLSADKAVITPIIQMVYPRIYYIPQLTYEYRNDTNMNTKDSDWRINAHMIDSRPAYKTLDNFDFMK